MNDEMIRLARRFLRLHKRPYNSETCDADHVELEETAIALATSVISEATDIAHAKAEAKSLGGRPKVDEMMINLSDEMIDVLRRACEVAMVNGDLPMSESRSVAQAKEALIDAVMARRPPPYSDDVRPLIDALIAAVRAEIDP